MHVSSGWQKEVHYDHHRLKWPLLPVNNRQNHRDNIRLLWSYSDKRFSYRSARVDMLDASVVLIVTKVKIFGIDII